MEKLFFLGGMCRSGATLLGSILNQNSDVHVNKTSPLVDVQIGIDQHLAKLSQQYTFDVKAVVDSFMKNSYRIYFEHIDKKYIIDNGRSWPGNISEIKKYIDPNPKLICTYRSVPEIITSFIALDKEDNDNAIRHVLKQFKLEPTTKNIAEIAWEVMSKAPWEALRKGLLLHPENILLVNYHDLIDDPKLQVDRIYEFLEIPKYEHSFNNIINTLDDPKDYEWGFRNLHKIRKDIAKKSLDPVETLGPDLYDYYSKFDKLIFEGIDESRLRR